MLFTATINTPGYLPEGDDEPPVFASARAAWDYLADERREAEDSSVDIDIDDFQGYSATLNQLEERARGNADTAYGPIDEDTLCGTIYGPTPGYDGDHDLGKAYSVATAEALDVWLRIPKGEEASESEANTYRIEDGYRVEWYHTAVGQVSHRDFDTYDEARAWLQSEGFEDYSS